MESTRLSKIERLLQKELSDIFQRQTQAMHGLLISVSVVRVSPDLSVARAYLSIFPSGSRRKCSKISVPIRKPSALISDNASGNRSARFRN